MATTALKGSPVETAGDLPEVGSRAPDFTLVKGDLSETGLASFAGMNVVLNIFPSIDTPVCAASVRRFNAEAGARENTVVLCISADLPFAHERFCGAEGLENVVSLSTFRDQAFGADYGVVLATGPLQGLMSRAVVVLDADGVVVHAQLAPEITEEPDYATALAALG